MLTKILQTFLSVIFLKPGSSGHTKKKEKNLNRSKSKIKHAKQYSDPFLMKKNCCRASDKKL